MRAKEILIATGTLARDALAGQVAIVTGAGRGIGFEAARSLAWLGARVIVAEIDQKTGKAAAKRIVAEMGAGAATFVRTDVGDEGSVNRLARSIQRSHGPVDVVLNNATVAPLGAIKDKPIADWDASYQVNLRGPVLLARTFLPGMLQRDRGVFVCVSSTPGAYMGPYEVFKTAQVELANILGAELEGTSVIAFTIGPGLARTPGAEAGIAVLAPLHGKSVEEFYAMNQEHIISAEEAGAGFAAAVALAARFRGQEIGSRQALITAGIGVGAGGQDTVEDTLADETRARAVALCRSVRATLAAHAGGWAERPLFERQWCIRDFRKHAGMAVEEWLALLDRLADALTARNIGAIRAAAPLGGLARYYEHLRLIMQGFERDPARREEYASTLRDWEEEAAMLGKLLG